MKNFKVILWGLGNVGRSSLIHILSKKELELVGVYDVDPGKIGKDAGEILGTDKLGITVSDDREGLLSKNADIVMYYTPQFYNGESFTQDCMIPTCDDICDILSHEKNLITTDCMYFSQKLAPELFEKIDRTAKEHGVTYVQQGIFPGLFAPYLPVILGMGTRNVESVCVSAGEPDDLNPAPWAAALSFGKNLEDVDAQILHGLSTRFMCDYGGITIEIAERMGLDYDEYFQNLETLMSDIDIDTHNPSFGLIKKGTIGAHVLNMGVRKNGKEVVGFHFIHKGHSDILKEYSLDFCIDIKAENHVIANIEGFLPLDCDVFLTSAAPNVNLIPAVVAAEPGYKGALDIAVTYLPR